MCPRTGQPPPKGRRAAVLLNLSGPSRDCGARSAHEGGAWSGRYFPSARWGASMLVVTVELRPHGVEEASEILADATIVNLGRVEAGYSYRARLRERPDPELAIRGRDQMVQVSGYDRRQSVWNLVLRVITAAWRDHEIESLEDYRPALAWAEDTEADSEALALFLDVLPSAWGLTETQVERLLQVAPGWLRAWRNHEVRIDQAVRTRLWKLGLLQKRLCLVSRPESYSAFWHRAWAATSPIGNRSPWRAFEQEGDEALTKIGQFLDTGIY